jgi:hypothetical protein
VTDFFSHRFLTEDTLGRFVDLDYVAASPAAIGAEREGLKADVKRRDGEIAKLVALDRSRSGRWRPRTAAWPSTTRRKRS